MKFDLTALYADIDQLLLRDQLLLKKRLAGIEKMKNPANRLLN